MSKSIVIFFSHAGDNYSVGNVEVGNTKIVADYITDIIGVDQFEIVTHKYDGMAYTPLIELAKKAYQCYSVLHIFLSLYFLQFELFGNSEELPILLTLHLHKYYLYVQR